MDTRYFLNQRLTFIRQLYHNGVGPFIERKRKIEAEEEPYEPPYSEDGEPAFLAEWLEAEESIRVLGQTCLSMLSASLHLYFKACEHDLRVSAKSLFKSEFKKGWPNGYKAYFQSFGISFEAGPCEFSLLEELVLARNRVQHPDSITTHSSHYSDEDLRTLPRPFFVSERERELLVESGEDEHSWLVPLTIEVTSEKLHSVLDKVEQFAEWLEKRIEECRRGRSRLSVS